MLITFITIQIIYVCIEIPQVFKLKTLFGIGVYVTAWVQFQILSLYSANRKGFARLCRYFTFSCVAGMRKSTTLQQVLYSAHHNLIQHAKAAIP